MSAAREIEETLSVVKTRVNEDERAYVMRLAVAEERSVAQVLRRLIREAMTREES